ncbi:MAG: hypothetical protein HZA51_01220 [Planctomycetes bacterium]|nr:hypothetical protein [Planctomycetota bacterium]
MKSPNRITAWIMIALLSCSLVGSAGCENVNVNYILPLGFGGTPGVFNPFGITQAFVNAWLGAVLPSSSSSSSGSSSSVISTSPTPDLSNVGGAIGGVVNNRPGE